MSQYQKYKMIKKKKVIINEFYYLLKNFQVINLFSGKCWEIVVPFDNNLNRNL